MARVPFPPDNVIITRLSGGLGNQLFQYATARNLALKHDAPLFLDASTYRNQPRVETPRQFELMHFAFHGQVLDEPPHRIRLARRLGALSKPLTGLQLHVERSDTFDLRVLSLPDDTYLSGYWQSFRYFESSASELFSDLQPRQPLSEASRKTVEVINASSSVALHVRRGDYVSSPKASEFHGVLGDSYYVRALERVRALVPDPLFFIFSDDVPWCQEHLGLQGKQARFISWNKGADAWQDFVLMSHCRHHVIANSSFSWWGAWMADRRWGEIGRLVIGPKEWFAGKQTSRADRFPLHWTIF